MKEFFEDPALLVGLPFIAVGVLGLLIAFATLAAPEPTTERGPRVAAHPDEAEYIKVGAVLAVLTAIEVGIYYFDIQRELFVTILIGLSLAKFTAVVMWFMHLKFDSRLFTTAFVSGLLLAAAVFTVVIATLGSNLV